MKSSPRPARWNVAVSCAGAIALHAVLATAQEVCGDWTTVPSPAGATSISLVTAVSENDAWALAAGVGAIRWDGTTWNPVSLPDLSGMGSSFSLRATTSLAPAKFFAAGILVTSVWTTEQLLLGWDGSGWDVVASVELAPNLTGAPRYGSPAAIAGVSPNDLWILGNASGFGDGVSGSPLLTVHWDGSQLTEFVTPGVGNRQNNVYGADAIASNDMWAVGEYNNTTIGDHTFHGMTYHYDGTSWTHVANPAESIDSSHLYAVAAIAADDVWAAGDTPAGPLFMHWDGSNWTIVPSPTGASGTIHALAAIATDDVWAVDSAWQVPSIGKYYHWDGVSWSVVVPPEIPGATSVARHGGLAAAGACDVWATGSIDLGQGGAGFIERLRAGSDTPSAAHGVEPSLAVLHVAPNPLRDSAALRVDLAGERFHSARVYDVRGQRVRTLIATPDTRDRLVWDGRDSFGEQVAGGVYFVIAQTVGGKTLVRKLTVVR